MKAELIIDAPGLAWGAKQPHPIKVGRDASLGYTHIGDSFSVRLVTTDGVHFALQRENGALGDGLRAGEFVYRSMELRVDGQISAPVLKNTRLVNSRSRHGLVLGGGLELFPGRAAIINRFAVGPDADWKRCYEPPALVDHHPFLALPHSLAHLKGEYDAKADRMLECMATGTPDESVGLLASMGEWMPHGYPDKGVVSGLGINAFPGWHRSSRYTLVEADTRGQRNRIHAYDAKTGKAFVRQRLDYEATGGWGKVTELPEFAEPLSDSPWDDRRKPRRLNEGVVDYEPQLVGWAEDVAKTTENPTGLRWHNGYILDDNEHAIRYFAELMVGAFRFGDPLCTHNLLAEAANLWRGIRLVPQMTHQGSEFYMRQHAWTLHALAAADAVLGFGHAQDWWEIGANEAQMPATRLARALADIQHPARGNFQDFPGEDENGNPKWYSWAPHPVLNQGLPKEYHYASCEQQSYMSCALALVGMHSVAELCMRRMLTAPFVPTQWMCWKPGEGAYTRGCGPIWSYQMWSALAALVGRYPRMRALVDGMVAPGRPTTIRDSGNSAKDELLLSGQYQACAKMLERLDG